MADVHERLRSGVRRFAQLVEGCQAGFAELACLMVLLAGADLLAQPGQPRAKAALQGALAGLCGGTLLAAVGLEIDLTSPCPC